MAIGNLGIKQKDLDEHSGFGIAVETPSDPEARRKEEGEKVKYPSFTLTNKHIEAAGLKDVNPDDTIEFTVRARVSSVEKKGKGAPSYKDNRVELEVQNIDDVTMIEDADNGETPEKKSLDSAIGFDTGKMKKGGGSLSPSTAGVKLKR